MVFFFQYNLAIQLLTCNSALLITKTTFHKSQQEPGYFTGLVNAQPLLIAPCKQMPGPCWSPLSKAHGGLPTCDTAINGGTWTGLNINGFVTLVSGFHRISGHVTSAESQATFRHYWKSSLNTVDVVGSNDEPTGGFGGVTTNLWKKKKGFGYMPHGLEHSNLNTEKKKKRNRLFCPAATEQRHSNSGIRKKKLLSWSNTFFPHLIPRSGHGHCEPGYYHSLSKHWVTWALHAPTQLVSLPTAVWEPGSPRAPQRDELQHFTRWEDSAITV